MNDSVSLLQKLQRQRRKASVVRTSAMCEICHEPICAGGVYIYKCLYTNVAFLVCKGIDVNGNVPGLGYTYIHINLFS